MEITPTLASGHFEDTLDDWRLYDGVLSRRVLAFVIDYVFILILLVPAAIVIAFLGFVTFGAAWLAYAILGPGLTLLYFAWSLGGTSQASPGMRIMGVEMKRLDGGKVDWVLAIVHTVLFWAGNVVLTPLILLAPLFLNRKRTVHDLLIGTAFLRSQPE